MRPPSSLLQGDPAAHGCICVAVSPCLEEEARGREKKLNELRAKAEHAILTPCTNSAGQKTPFTRPRPMSLLGAENRDSRLGSTSRRTFHGA